jgi:hypothetical protein
MFLETSELNMALQKKPTIENVTLAMESLDFDHSFAKVMNASLDQ